MLITALMSQYKALDFDALTDHLASSLIYVIGNARGGSTFANSAIGSHPKVLCVEWNDKTFSDVWFKRDQIDNRALSAQLLKPGKHFDPAIIRAAIGEENLARWNAHVDRVCRSRDLKYLFCIQGLLYWIMTGAKSPLHDFKAWCVKANTWEGFFELRRQLPATKVVFVERDPRSTSLSLAKVYARERRQSFEDQDVVRGAINWLRNATEFAVRLHRYPDTYLLYYERLVADPARELNKLYTRLGLGDPAGNYRRRCARRNRVHNDQDVCRKEPSEHRRAPYRSSGSVANPAYGGTVALCLRPDRGSSAPLWLRSRLRRQIRRRRFRLPARQAWTEEPS